MPYSAKKPRGLEVLWLPRPNFMGGGVQQQHWREDAPSSSRGAPVKQPLLSPTESSDSDLNTPLSSASSAAAGGISGLGLAAIGFFWVSGGSYGNEALVLAAPPGILFLTITCIGLSYGVPLAIITAELGTGWPVAGGMGQWVEIAMGEAMGAHNAWWIWVCYVFDGAIYPVLAAQYLAHYTTVSQFQQSLYATFIVFAMTLVKLGGREILEKMATALAILTLMPSLIYWTGGLIHGGISADYLLSVDGDPCTLLGSEELCTATNASSCTWGSHQSWLDDHSGGGLDGGSAGSGGAGALVDDGGESCGGLNLSVRKTPSLSHIHINTIILPRQARDKHRESTRNRGPCFSQLLLSYVMWLYSGFISLGSLAGELEDPVKAYWTALLILVPVVVVLNCMPLIISMTLDHDRNNFQPGALRSVVLFHAKRHPCF